MERIVFLDTETAGFDPQDGVVEIALIEVDGNLDIIDTHHSLIDPEGPIRASASGVHGITYDMVAESPTLRQFFDMEGPGGLCDAELLVIGHNIQFDLRFLEGYLRSDNASACTLRLARHLYPDVEDHKLQTLRYEFGLAAGDAHSALGDTILCLNFFRMVAEQTGLSVSELVALSAKPIMVKTMPFGKHKGLPLQDLPRSYRSWLLDKAEIDEDLRHSLCA